MASGSVQSLEHLTTEWYGNGKESIYAPTKVKQLFYMQVMSDYYKVWSLFSFYTLIIFSYIL